MYLMLNGWDTNVKFSSCHFIPGHERCGCLHGHVYAISAKIHGEPNVDGIILDFIKLKAMLRELAEELDHRLILPGNSRHLSIQMNDDQVEVTSPDKFYSFPATDVVILDIESSSAEALAAYMLTRVAADFDMPGNVTRIEIGVDEGRGQGAWVEK
jgi:6-pyruvoyltetrahydropterin/6-carboxytetrahydropterin synthase